MSNRKQRRTYDYYNKEKPVPIKLTAEFKNGVIIAVVIVLIFVGAYFATVYLTNKGNLSDYEPSKAGEAVITHDNINIGMVFNRSDDEYYVAFEDFGDKNKTAFYELIKKYSSNEKALPIYKVDMNIGYNSKYKSEKSNEDVNDVEDLKIKTPTLIKIENGKNVLYIDNLEDIKDELSD